MKRLVTSRLALVVAMTYIVLRWQGAPQRKQHMGSPNPWAQRLYNFRGAYGRLCVLQAQALQAGEPPQRVQRSAQGHGQYGGAHHAIRDQRDRVDATLAACATSNIGRTQIVKAAQEAKWAVEQEFAVKLHMSSERWAQL